MLSFFCLNQRISIHYVVGKPVDCIVQFSVVGNYVKFRARSNKKFFAIEHLLKILTHSLCYPGTKLTSIDKTMIPLAVFGVLAVLMTTGVECGKYFLPSELTGKQSICSLFQSVPIDSVNAYIFLCWNSVQNKWDNFFSFVQTKTELNEVKPITFLFRNGSSFNSSPVLNSNQ